MHLFQQKKINECVICAAQSRSALLGSACDFKRNSQVLKEMWKTNKEVDAADVKYFKDTTKLYLTLFFPSEAMHVERKWHVLLTIFFLLITSGQCLDSKKIKPETRTLLDLILRVIRDKPVSRRCGGVFHSAQDMKFSSPEKPFYRLDNSRLMGKLIRFIFRTWWWKHNPHFTVGDICHWSVQCLW